MSEAEDAVGEPVAALPADIEWLVQWALEQTGNLPWRRGAEADLAFDRGLTAKPRRREPGSWILAQACAGLRFGAATHPFARKQAPSDAEKILAEIRKLDPRTASLVIACGRQKIRPDWMEGIEPRLVQTGSKRCKKKHRRIPQYQWKPCAPQAIREARERYERWHGGMTALLAILHGRLSRFRVNGLAAPSAPWNIPEKTAA